MKSCSTCAHISRQWSEQPCVSCQQEERGNWEPLTEGRSGDGLARRIRVSYPNTRGAHSEDGSGGHFVTLEPIEPPMFAILAAQSQKARRRAIARAIAREWSTYLGVKIRARHVKAMLRLADDVEGGE